MLVLHRGEASGIVTGLHAGTSGSLLVLLICILYAPTAVVWGTSYLAGPGFAVGTGTSVAITGVHLGAVPALPLLAALPVLEGRRELPGRSRSRPRWRPASLPACWSTARRAGSRGSRSRPGATCCGSPGSPASSPD